MHILNPPFCNYVVYALRLKAWFFRQMIWLFSVMFVIISLFWGHNKLCPAAFRWVADSASCTPGLLYHHSTSLIPWGFFFKRQSVLPMVFHHCQPLLISYASSRHKWHIYWPAFSNPWNQTRQKSYLHHHSPMAGFEEITFSSPCAGKIPLPPVTRASG